MLVRKITQYLTKNGERIEELTLIDSVTMGTPTPEQIASDLETDEPLKIYLGIMLIPVGVSDSSGNMIDVRPQEYRFTIEANTLEEACNNFAATSEEAIKELKQRSEERKQQTDSGLIIPNAEESAQINRFKI